MNRPTMASESSIRAKRPPYEKRHHGKPRRVREDRQQRLMTTATPFAGEDSGSVRTARGPIDRRERNRYEPSKKEG